MLAVASCAARQRALAEFQFSLPAKDSSWVNLCDVQSLLGAVLSKSVEEIIPRTVFRSKGVFSQGTCRAGQRGIKKPRDEVSGRIRSRVADRLRGDSN